MKFSITAQDLKRALNTCNEIAPASSAIAEEKTGVLVRVEDKSAIFMSSDDTSYIRVEVPAEVQESGEALVRCTSVASSVAATFEDFGFDGEPTVVRLETTSKATLKVAGANKVSKNKALSHVRNFPLLNVDFFIETPEFETARATKFPAHP